MKIISTNYGDFGPYTNIIVGEDRYYADGDEIIFSVLQGDVTIVEVNPPPVLIVPQEITMRQARLVLLEHDLLANVQVAINSLPEPNKTKAQIEWDYSNVLQRNNLFVTLLGTALGLTDVDIDNLFIEGSTM